MYRLKGIKLLSLLTLPLLTMIILPEWAYCMGSGYDDCSAYKPAEINRLAILSLELTKKVKYEASKYPTRLSTAPRVMSEIEYNLQKAKSMTEPGKIYSYYVVQQEVSTFAKHMTSLRDGYGDIMSQLFAIFRESIEATNADKRYWLGKLAEMNDVSSALGNYLKQLNEAAISADQQCGEPSGTIKRYPKLESR